MINTKILKALVDGEFKQYGPIPTKKLVGIVNNSLNISLDGEEEEVEEDNSPETLTEDQAVQLQNMVGGAQAYNDMLIWAGQNLSKEDCDVFDSVVGKGDPNSCLFAIQALNAKYQEAVGNDGRLLTGQGAVDKQDVFRSQQEVVQAMSDPRYEKDPAFRNDVYAKLERSNIAY